MNEQDKKDARMPGYVHLGAEAATSGDAPTDLQRLKADEYGDRLSMKAVLAIRDGIKPGDGWGGDEWDYALANAVAAHCARIERAAAPASQFRKLTSELSLNELAREFFAVSALGGDVTLSAGACRKLFDAMTTPPAAAPATASGDELPLKDWLDAPSHYSERESRAWARGWKDALTAVSATSGDELSDDEILSLDCLRLTSEGDEYAVASSSVIEFGRAIEREVRAAVSAATKPAPLDLKQIEDIESVIGAFNRPEYLADAYKNAIAACNTLRALLRAGGQPVATKPAAAPADRATVLREVEAVIEQAISDMLTKKGQVAGATFCLDAVRAMLAATPAASTPAAPAEQVASDDGWPTPADLLAEALDNIAEQWTECMYEASSGDIDIGASLRAEFAKLNLAIPAASTTGAPEGYVLMPKRLDVKMVQAWIGPYHAAHGDIEPLLVEFNESWERMIAAAPAPTTGAAQTAEQVRDQALEEAAKLFEENPHAEQFHCNIAEQIRELKGGK